MTYIEGEYEVLDLEGLVLRLSKGLRPLGRAPVEVASLLLRGPGVCPPSEHLPAPLGGLGGVHGLNVLNIQAQLPVVARAAGWLRSHGLQRVSPGSLHL